jgi:hypothetical protein
MLAQRSLWVTVIDTYWPTAEVLAIVLDKHLAEQWPGDPQPYGAAVCGIASC